MSRNETLVLEGTLTPSQTLTYPMLPFEVPPHTERIDVEYTYSAAIGSDPHLTGGNTIDIGIFDPRGHTFMGEGFRGWSGSARSAFFIAANESTPGYLAGPIQSGTWHISLGAYKVADDGCAYRVTILLTIGDLDSGTTFPQRLPLSNAPRPDVRRDSGWYRGELHCHTHHSDGDSDVATVISRAEALGLDFLAITDHNSLSHQVALASAETRLMLIPGLEVTTYKGHWNIWGAGPWIDFRVLSQDDMQTAVNAALDAGYLISCNHPRPYGPEWVYPGIVGFHCIEVWNGPWRLMNDVSLAYWETKLQTGPKHVAVGGSDCHFHHSEHRAKLANPTTVIYCPGDPSPAALLAALKAGHAYVTESPDGPEVVLIAGPAMMGDTLYVDGDTLPVTVTVRRAPGTRLQIVSAAGVTQQFAIDRLEWVTQVDVDVRDTPYVRAQVVSGKPSTLQVHALTNPIYIERTPL
ncbi:MAG: PHP domain-containing protein [Chloroflexi bacterium]|nr:PHP domain-containing protein [Chloroflexota bacterium]